MRTILTPAGYGEACVTLGNCTMQQRVRLAEKVPVLKDEYKIVKRVNVHGMGYVWKQKFNLGSNGLQRCDPIDCIFRRFQISTKMSDCGKH